LRFLRRRFIVQSACRASGLQELPAAPANFLTPGFIVTGKVVMARRKVTHPFREPEFLPALSGFIFLVGAVCQACGSSGGMDGGGGGSAEDSTHISQAASMRAPLPPWLAYCDTEPCTSIEPVVIFACPVDDPQCTPLRTTAIVPEIDDNPVSGVFFPLVGPADTSIRLVSGNGNVVSSLVWAYRASKVIFGSAHDVAVSYYNVVPVWGGTTPLNFTSTLSTSALLDSVFYRNPNYDIGTAAIDLHARGETVVTTQRAMTGMTSEHVTVYFVPTELVSTQAGEGNFSFGNGTVTINYGNPAYVAARGGIMNTAIPRFAHEYAHELVDEIRPAFAGNFSCLNEGIADALPYAAGYLPEEEFGPVGLMGIDFDRGCTALTEMHDVGNCYLWHVKKAGLLNSSFLRALFHPQHAFSFDSCAQNTVETGNNILVYFTEAAGGTDMIPVLDSMKIPHAGSYEAAKHALGF